MCDPRRGRFFGNATATGWWSRVLRLDADPPAELADFLLVEIARAFERSGDISTTADDIAAPEGSLAGKAGNQSQQHVRSPDGAAIALGDIIVDVEIDFQLDPQEFRQAAGCASGLLMKDEQPDPFEPNSGEIGRHDPVEHRVAA